MKFSVRQRAKPLAVSALLFALLGALQLLMPGAASAVSPASCSQVFHYSQDGYQIYKYECSGNQAYGYMTGNPGNSCITISLGNVSDGPCYHIPVGYTPPRTSIQTPTVNAGSSVKLVDICFVNSFGVTDWCHNDYG
jgi:hypothetical protein